MKKIVIFILTITTLISCAKDRDDVYASGVRIRLSNISQFNFENIIVNTSNGDVAFENLNAGEKSEYKVFQLAYRYAFIELEIDGKTYTIQPVDYVGETPLEIADYTYEINANDSEGQYGKLSLGLIEDKK